MADFKIAYNKVSKQAMVLTEGQGLPDGAEDLGHFTFEDSTITPSNSFNKVAFHYVRDALYKVGEQNMQAVRISVSPDAYDEASAQGAKARHAITGERTEPLDSADRPSDYQNKPNQLTSVEEVNKDA